MKIPVAFFIGLFIFYNSYAQPVELHGKLHVQDAQLTDEHQQPVVLN